MGYGEEPWPFDFEYIVVYCWVPPPRTSSAAGVTVPVDSVTGICTQRARAPGPPSAQANLF